MKEKKFQKNLVLNKETIVDLTDKQKADILAGGVYTTKGSAIVCCATACDPQESICICE